MELKRSRTNIMRAQIIDTILSKKLIVIVRNLENENIFDFAKAVYKAGIRLLEITYDADGTKNEQTATAIKMLSENFDDMYIGAGTVLTEEQVELTKMAGGKFIISPNVCKKVIEKTREIGLVSMPGALTPSEIYDAHTYGADFVKMFPAVNLGPEYIKAVQAPLSNIKLLAVGGINENNMSDYLNAGVCGFGIGSNIVNKTLIESGNFDAITALAEKYVMQI